MIGHLLNAGLLGIGGFMIGFSSMDIRSLPRSHHDFGSNVIGVALGTGLIGIVLGFNL
jgi:hypothetical protein